MTQFARPKNFIFSGLIVVFMTGCNSDQYEDLTRFMDEVRAQPRGNIEPLPTFTQYEAFTYSASGERSPFDEPMIDSITRSHAASNIQPDLGRAKQFLENFVFDSFNMVGTLSDDNGFFALLSSDVGVHRVQVGDYLGHNHGRIISISEAEIQVVEIIKNGLDNWMERPRKLNLNGS